MATHDLKTEAAKERSRPEPLQAARAKPMVEPVRPAPAKPLVQGARAKSPVRAWLVLFAVLGLIALLLWWLFA